MIAFKSPSGHRCERQEHEFPQERMTLFDTLRQDGKAEELFNKFPKQQNGSSFLIRAASLHALAQFDQRLVEALEAGRGWVEEATAQALFRRGTSPTADTRF